MRPQESQGVNMAQFRDSEAAGYIRERLESASGAQLDRLFGRGFELTPDPDMALANLERWLAATGSAPLHLQQIEAQLAAGKRLLYLLGASQPIADTLIQNPELSSLIFEPSQAGMEVSTAAVIDEGMRLLSSSTSYTHSLDRLRYLRQKWNLVIVMNDLAGTWEQEKVWRALSDLADGLLQLAVNVVWSERGGDGECPLMIVSYGKLAGHELNYSSDVDLVYIAPDGGAELARFCEALTRALSDRMGRGSLYRVDLRLRPYGAGGPIVQSITAMESYYRRYAEPWEVQALVRTRPVVGPPDVRASFEELRNEICFRPKLSEPALEQMISMRDRISDHGAEDDLKRGAGGIRDVEFLVQILQLLHGHDLVDLRTSNTLEAVRRLDEHGLIGHADALSLIEGYTFLRKLEHRTQLVGDRQTHSIPSSSEARRILAILMGMRSWPELEASLDIHRRTIQTLYRSILKLDLPAQDDRGEVYQLLGTAALQWLDVLPESSAFYSALIENEGSLRRVRRLLELAPKLVPYFKASVPLTELLFSGEIEEDSGVVGRMTALPIDTPLKAVADTYIHAFTTVLARWSLAPFPVWRDLTALLEGLLLHCCRRLYIPFDVIALGSFGAQEVSPASDGDLLFLTASGEGHRDAEFQAQQLLGMIGEIRRLGAPVNVDLRLRPDGGKGLLVRTYDGLRHYDLEGMEMWERFALGNARLIQGNPEALEVVRHSAYGLPLTPERLRELIRMKRRIETERLKPQHLRRNIKIGHGGLSDIEWLVHLHEMRYPTAMHGGETTDMEERIRWLGRAGLMNMLEVQALLEARAHLLDLRIRLYLMGQAEDRVPENPDRLDRLATSLGERDGNAFLARHEQIIDAVRRLYTEALERLRA